MEPAAADPVRVLLSTYLFRDLTPAELEPLTKTLRSRKYERGGYVFHAGDPAEFLCIVSTGQIKYSMTTAKGYEYVYEVLTSGAAFGEPGLFAPERNRVLDAIAMEPSNVLFIRRDRLIDFMQRHQAVMMRMIQGFAADLRSEVEVVTDIGYAEIRGRVVRKLLDLATDHGREREDGSIEIVLTISQGTLAGLVGATRENVNRAVSALTSDGDLQVLEGRFVIRDPARLRRTADRGWSPLSRRNRLFGERPGE